MLPRTLVALLLRNDLERYGLCGSEAGLAERYWLAVVERTRSVEFVAVSLSSSDKLEPRRIRSLLVAVALEALVLMRSTERVTVDDFMAKSPAFSGNRRAHSVVYSSSIAYGDEVGIDIACDVGEALKELLCFCLSVIRAL